MKGWQKTQQGKEAGYQVTNEMVGLTTRLLGALGYTLGISLHVPKITTSLLLLQVTTEHSLTSFDTTFFHKTFGIRSKANWFAAFNLTSADYRQI